MSSSDSEDDSFLNIAKKLTDLQKNIRIDAIDVDDNNSKQKAVPSSSPVKKRKNKQTPVKKSAKPQSGSENSDSDIDIDQFRLLYPPINETKRKTRGRPPKRKTAPSAQSSPNLADSQTSLPRRRKKNNASSTVTSENAGNCSTDTWNNILNESGPPSRRGRGRGRGRGRARGRGRNSSRSSFNTDRDDSPNFVDILRSMIPVYSVGNTDEYPDQCDNQQLFGARKDPVPVVEEILDDTLEDNEELSVKVIWQSSDFFKFQIRKYQKITVIFDFFANREKVSHDKLLFEYNDTILKPDDTPDSINYTIAKFIEGGVVNQSIKHITSNSTEVKDGVKLKFQCQNVKKPFETYVKPDDKLSHAMMRCAEHFEKPIDKLKFEFDGDQISGKQTPRELELEGGECIDVKIIS